MCLLWAYFVSQMGVVCRGWRRVADLPTGLVMDGPSVACHPECCLSPFWISGVGMWRVDQKEEKLDEHRSVVHVKAGITKLKPAYFKRQGDRWLGCFREDCIRGHNYWEYWCMFGKERGEDKQRLWHCLSLDCRVITRKCTVFYKDIFSLWWRFGAGIGG